MTQQLSINVPDSVLNECGPPNRVFRYRNNPGVKLLMGVSFLVGTVLVGFAGLLLFVYHTSESTEVIQTTAAIVGIHAVCGVIATVGVLMLSWPFRQSRRGREGFAAYPDMLVHFGPDQLRKIPYSEIGEIAGRESGALTIRFHNGESFSISKRLPAVRKLATMIQESISPRTLQVVIDELAADRIVAFGSLGAKVAGVVYQGREVEWDAIDRFDVEPGRRITVYLKQQDGRSKRAFAIAESRLRDPELFLELLNNLSPRLVRPVERSGGRKAAPAVADPPQPRARQTGLARQIESPAMQADIPATPAETDATRPAVRTTQSRDNLERVPSEAAGAGRYQLLIYGGLLLLSCLYLNHVFGELESGVTESVRIWWGFALLYNSVGPTATLAIVGVAGVILSVFGINNALIPSDRESAAGALEHPVTG